jgi:hypothetical protein
MAKYIKLTALRMEPETHALVLEAAAREQVSASSFMRRAIVERLRRDGYARQPGKAIKRGSARNSEAEVAAA